MNAELTSSWLATSLQCSNRVLRISRQLLVMPTSHNVAAVCLHTSEEALKNNKIAHRELPLTTCYKAICKYFTTAAATFLKIILHLRTTLRIGLGSWHQYTQQPHDDQPNFVLFGARWNVLHILLKYTNCSSVSPRERVIYAWHTFSVTILFPSHAILIA